MTTLLPAVLDRLLPQNAALPGAGGLGLAGAVGSDAADSPERAAALAEILGALPEDFATLSPAAQVDALRALERARPQAFALLVELAYTAYYSDARVLAALEPATGYASRPPQPAGHALDPFDPDAVRLVSARAPFWRRPPDNPEAVFVVSAGEGASRKGEEHA